MINRDHRPRDEVSGEIVELINLEYCPRYEVSEGFVELIKKPRLLSKR